jgi:hypothetical protein
MEDVSGSQQTARVMSSGAERLLVTLASQS